MPGSGPTSPNERRLSSRPSPPPRRFPRRPHANAAGAGSAQKPRLPRVEGAHLLRGDDGGQVGDDEGHSVVPHVAARQLLTRSRGVVAVRSERLPLPQLLARPRRGGELCSRARFSSLSHGPGFSLRARRESGLWDEPRAAGSSLPELRTGATSASATSGSTPPRW